MNEQTTEHRLRQLEREGRRSRLGILVGVALVASLAYLGAGQRSAGIMRAERFEVTDPKGNVRGYLGLSEGKAPVPILAFMDKIGTQRVFITLGEDGNPTISLLDDRGDGRAVFALGRDGSPGLSLSGAAGKGGIGLTLYHNGGCEVTILDQRDRERAILRLQADGASGFALQDAKGVERAAVLLAKDGNPEVRMLTKDARVLWKAPPHGRPSG
jgi:hypothetical protein